jgi:hypothetical protein
MDPGTPVNVPPPPNSVPSWQGLTTTMLRQIAITNNINNCANQTGITQNRTIGLAFEGWVLKTRGWLKSRWTKPIFSQARQNKNQGLPASVIPEYVANQVAFTLSGSLNLTWSYFPNSVIYEVKAVTGNLTPGTSQNQILGLLDVATTFPSVPAGPHAPPAVIFITTSNTTVSPAVVAQAITWGVAVWQQNVQYNANSATLSDPYLRIGPSTCLTPSLYPTGALLQLAWLDPQVSPWPQNPLTWVTVPEQQSIVVSGDPDPPEVD